jgi:hypothetical protein
MISPGVGIFGGLIAMFPQSVTKMSHLPAYGLLRWLLSGVLQGYWWPQRSALWVAIVIALVFGVGMDFLQGFEQVVDSGDVLMNSGGIGMATLLILWRSMAADKAEKLVPARSCAFHDLNKGARQPWHRMKINGVIYELRSPARSTTQMVISMPAEWQKIWPAMEVVCMAHT